MDSESPFDPGVLCASEHSGLLYSSPMTAPIHPRVLPKLFAWGRVRFTVIVAAVLGLLLSAPFKTAAPFIVARAIAVGLVCLLLFGLFERWPKRLPGRVSRTVLQLLAIAVALPAASGLAFLIITDQGVVLDQRTRFVEYLAFVFTGVLFAPWIAVGATLKQRDSLAHEQALAFELERSELYRKALDAKLRLLQSQIEPHFLFNTLANVQALVDAGSPHASRVLESLIAYLRAAVPRIQQAATTLGQEMELVSAYLSLMRMRIPDRLEFALHVDPAALNLSCPPMTVLTLVENAVRHGIDPGEDGGRIDVRVELRAHRCSIQVIDTGVGLNMANAGLGTGLSTLRERLQLAYGSDVRMNLAEHRPRGVVAELEFPAQELP
jgi:hypothetical protein